ncbi:nudix hydrolase 20 chloroplastic [Phtheirospermum japonicum]|uniref:Nudix hydrolase 20 chloroplastic n=1 Tax=Phtheirospermum japonicum TaxID=374723 RepID=A0A830C355_9LAMI|nr:nudix hydrolase 20 chloroplastic [Phtheirospermum japonicum]
MGSNWYCVLRSSPLVPSFYSSCWIPRRSLNSRFCSLQPVVSPSSHIPRRDFSWDDVCKFSQTLHDCSDLRGFFDKVTLCNRNSEKQCEFIPFVIEEHIVGYVHNGFAQHLKRYKDVFTFPENPRYSGKWGCHVELHPALITPEDRTKAVGDVVKCLGEQLIPGIRNELYPVRSSFETPEFFLLERAAAPYFGIKAYGVHMNGYVERENMKYLWIGKRSKVKPTHPGKLDHLVAGGLVYKIIANSVHYETSTQPHGISCEDNIVKECEEEAGIPRSISRKATAVGAVSYLDIDGYRLKRDVLFCYDLELPEDFVPANKGKVESFNLVLVTHVANIIRSTNFFKDNCNLVIIDFLFRHGYIKPEGLGYLKLLQSLRSGDCT